GDEERALADMLESVGPVVSIGRPGEFAPRLGAHRLYVENASWQAAVSALISKASFVFVLAGSTPGLGWELTECMERLRPGQLFFLIPNDAKTFDRFKELVSQQTGQHLPVGPNYFRKEKFHLSDVFAPLRQIRDPGKVLGLVTFSEG